MTRSLLRPPDAQQTLRPLVDKIFESWVCWRQACEAVESAYVRWQQCEAADRRLAFAGYQAALDREDHAAQLHAICARRVREATNEQVVETLEYEPTPVGAAGGAFATMATRRLIGGTQS
jgi:hypothetical protein